METKSNPHLFRPLILHQSKQNVTIFTCEFQYFIKHFSHISIHSIKSNFLCLVCEKKNYSNERQKNRNERKEEKIVFYRNNKIWKSLIIWHKNIHLIQIFVCLTRNGKKIILFLFSFLEWNFYVFL